MPSHTLSHTIMATAFIWWRLWKNVISYSGVVLWEVKSQEQPAGILSVAFLTLLAALLLASRVRMNARENCWLIQNAEHFSRGSSLFHIFNIYLALLIISEGIKCKCKPEYSRYSNSSKVLEWIMENIVGLDDLSRSLPIQNILWFMCSVVSIVGICIVFILITNLKIRSYH